MGVEGFWFRGGLGCRVEGQVNLVSRLITLATHHIVTLAVPIMELRARPLTLPSEDLGFRVRGCARGFKVRLEDLQFKLRGKRSEWGCLGLGV